MVAQTKVKSLLKEPSALMIAVGICLDVKKEEDG